MKKFFAILSMLTIFGCLSANAQQDGFFYEDVLISNDVRAEENAQKAKSNASNLLNKKAEAIKLDVAPEVMPFRTRQSSGNSHFVSQPVIVSETATKYGEAPFGLGWGATYKQTKALGVELKPITIKNYPNSFSVSQLPKTLPDINNVNISFGEDNSLWRILAYGHRLEDEPDASKVMALYHRYYKLLEQKYGNAQQFFTPKITTIQKIIKDEEENETIETINIEEPIGNKNFLSDLKSGEAVLYATFENDKVGAALTVNVDGNGKSYIIIDFTNLQIFKEKEEQTLDAL